MAVSRVDHLMHNCLGFDSGIALHCLKPVRLSAHVSLGCADYNDYNTMVPVNMCSVSMFSIGKLFKNLSLLPLFLYKMHCV